MIYVASCTKHAPDWRTLRDAGLRTNSTWIDEAEPGQTLDKGELYARCLREVAEASCIIVFAPEGDVLKGALIELGTALGLNKRAFVACRSIWEEHPLVEVHLTLHAAVRDATAFDEAADRNWPQAKKESHAEQQAIIASYTEHLQQLRQGLEEVRATRDRDLVRRVADLEYDLTGDVRATLPLLEALGVESRDVW